MLAGPTVPSAMPRGYAAGQQEARPFRRTGIPSGQNHTERRSDVQRGDGLGTAGRDL